MKSGNCRGLPNIGRENDIDWSFISEAEDKERMCRSLDSETMPNCSYLASLHADRSEPSLSKRTKADDQGLFGSQRMKALLDISKTKESFKDKLLSMWTNTKNGFMARLTPDFNDSDIWMMGKQYENDFYTFKRDFYGLPWITYRRGFPELGLQRMTSDVGWGCMIRCAQMCLAVTLHLHLKSLRALHKDLDAKILRMFGDRPHADCPFSIHSIVCSGERKGRMAGSWFGPASVSVAVREVLRERQLEMDDFLNDLAIYIAQDSTVYIRDALDEMRKGRKSLMLIIPMRLGFHRINESYVEAFKRIFRWRFCTGVMGGRPRHSLFFVGHQEDDLIYLDPHFTQESVDLCSLQSQESYHCSTPMKLNIGKMDPTCAAAFYCSDEVELWDLISLVRQTEEELKVQKVTPGVPKQISLLHFVDARHLDLLGQDASCDDDVEVISDCSTSSDSGNNNNDDDNKICGQNLHRGMSKVETCPPPPPPPYNECRVQRGRGVGPGSTDAHLVGPSLGRWSSYGVSARSYLEYLTGTNNDNGDGKVVASFKATAASKVNNNNSSSGSGNSYSMLEGRGSSRDRDSSVDSCDFSFLSHFGRGAREEDGFVML